jgi:hypothetical protein
LQFVSRLFDKADAFELYLGFELHLPLALIADVQRAQANKSAITLQSREFVQRLQRILGVTSDELRHAQDNQTAEANTS